jgi:hypothetical protein
VAAKKKRKRPRNRPSAIRGSPTPVAADEARATAKPERRSNKEKARAAREAERKREQRAASLRRTAIFAVLGVGLLGVVWWTQRAPAAQPIPPAAAKAAQAAGCSGVQTPSGDAPGGLHLQSGQDYTYDQHPATSGYHDPGALPTTPEVYTTPVKETQAVHFLEHAGIILYYRLDGDAALPQDVVDRLAQVAKGQPNTLLIPYPDLPGGTALAMTTWNKLQTCPPTVTADQAGAIADGFARAFVCTSNAPEPKASPDC